jgi:hypothetical protein
LRLLIPLIFIPTRRCFAFSLSHITPPTIAIHPINIFKNCIIAKTSFVCTAILYR